MNTIKIKDIEIRYDSKQNIDIDYIKNVITNNYNLVLPFLGKKKILSLIPTNEEGVVWTSNFDNTFYEIVKKSFINEECAALFENPDILPALYIQTLIRKNGDNSNGLVRDNFSFDDEILYSYIAYVYYTKTGTFEEFVNYLKEKKELDKILKWFQDEIRFDAYNYLLKIIVEYLKMYDFCFLEDLSEFIKIFLSQGRDSTFEYEKEFASKVELPKITLQELDELFNDFLKYINAPQNWKQTYDELRTSGRISFENDDKNLEDSMCYRDKNNILRTLIPTDGTIKTFLALVHEFSHYFPMQDDTINFKQFSILELPSIFFEKLAIQFLKSKGYTQDILFATASFRNKNNMDIYTNKVSLFDELASFINNGPITRENKILFYENSNKTIRDLFETWKENGEQVDDSFLEMFDVDASKEVDKHCDLMIESFLREGLLLIRGYQYIFDTYLAEELLKQLNEDDTVVPKMINVTDNLSMFTLKDILSEFGIKNLSPNSNLTREKK